MTSLYWVFAVFDIGVLLLFVAEVTSRRGLSTRAKNAPSASAAAGLMVLSYVLQLAITAYAVFHQAQPPPRASVPLPLNSAIVDHKDLVVTSMLAIAGVQTYLLSSIYRRALGWRWIWLGSGLLVIFSVLSPVTVTDDVYAYVAYALLGKAAYAPPLVSFTGQFSPIDSWWSIPLPPSPYGPVWLVTAWLVTIPFSSLLAKVTALRILGAVSFLALIAIAHALRCPRRVVAVIALNPALAYEYVASAHNDAYGIVLVMCAALVVRRQPLIAAICVLAGGLVKVPFAFIGLALLRPIRSPLWRSVAFVALPVAAVLITVHAGGTGLVKALMLHVSSGPLMSVLSGSVAFLTGAAIAVAVFGRLRFRAVVWAIPLAASYTLASYVIWALPYAAVRRNVLSYMLIGLPLVTTLLEVKFMTVWTLFLVVPAVVAWQVVSIRASIHAPARSF